MTSPSKDDSVYLGHMLDIAREAHVAAISVDRVAYSRDRNLRLALAHLIQTIGEAARHVSLEFQRTHPQIDWIAIIGMRNRIVHDYLNVDEDIVWTTVTEELPVLIGQLERLGGEPTPRGT